jgi:hypothetical protein
VQKVLNNYIDDPDGDKTMDDFIGVLRVRDIFE